MSTPIESAQIQFRYGLYDLKTTLNAGETVSQAWQRAAQENDIDAGREVSFKRCFNGTGREIIQGSAVAEGGALYGVTVTLSKNG